MKDPIRYATDLEEREADEADTVAGLEAALRQIMETTARDLSHAIRSVHAKSHALIVGTLTVLPDLPPELAQGLFARPASTQRCSASP